MRTRKVALIGAALFAIGSLAACGSDSDTREEPTAAVGSGSEAEAEPEAEPEDEEDAEAVEFDPEKMSGELDQKQSEIFIEYALKAQDKDICELVDSSFPQDEVEGVRDLVLENPGKEQGVESVSVVGVMKHAYRECGY